MDDLFDTEQPMQRREPVLDVTSHVFQPKKYIQRVLAGIPHAVFEGELVDRVGQAEEDTGEALKQLIRDNLAVFVNSKDAMDAVYHSDQELFTGEALDGITSSFKSATASCDALVQPITATFVEVQKSRKSQDMLDKLFSVLGVPGAIYDCCGAKVATRRATATTGADNSGTSDEEGADKRGVEDGDDDDDNDDTDDAPQRQKNNVKAGGGARSRRMKSPYSDDDEEDEEDDEEDEESESGGSDVDKVHAAPPKAHGTLESPAGPTNLADVFIYTSEEEIYLWYGTPLVRLRDVDERRHHVEEVSNYEAAVLHLRRAMMYVEETYSLMDGTLLAGDDGDLPRSPTAQQQQHPASEGRLSPSPGAAASGGGGVNAGAAAARQASITASSFTSPGAVQRSAFAYKFAMALLRAALYLCSQLAEELVYANPADTVLIEDTLSTMMDASIATVKLRHFCSVLQKFIELGKQHKASLTKLRTQLAGPAGTDSTTAGDGTANDGAAKMAVGSSDPLGGATAATTAATAANAGLPRRRPPIYQHPVQYFVSIVQKQHRHLLSTSAAALLQEAKAWMWKAQTDAARGLEERHRQRELQRKLRAAAAATGVDATGSGGDAASLGATGTFGPAFANSFMGGSVAGEGGYIGNSNDSFLQDTSFGWVNRRGGGASSGSPTKLEGSGTAAPQRLDGTGSGGGGGGGGDAQQFVSLVPEAFVKRVLDAFNTPESPFPTVTELKVGASDMDAVLLSSCLQIRLHAASLLSQLFTRADVESAVMAQATSLNTFALRLCAECVGTLEHVVGAYWSGIATTVHAGVFDFAPDGVLKDMLAELLADSGDGAMADAQAAAAGAGGATADAAAGVSVRVSGEADGLQRSPSTMLGDGGSHLHSRTTSAVERDDSGTGVGGNGGGGGGADMINGGAAQSSAQRVPGMGSGSTDQLPRVRFVPVLPLALQQSLNAEAKMRATGTADPNAHPPCLRDTSVQAVHQMIATATTTLQSLFLTFINKGVVDGFVSTMARYRVSDAARYSRTERMELHAAVLYEILLGQWERMMNLVSDSVLRLKIVMGETSSSTTVHSDSQVEEVGDLLQALEALRSTCLRTYLHGVGVLSKAYLTMLPLLQRRSDTLLDSRVRSRLSRESVSSNTVHKLLNVLSVVVDRCVPFFTRDTEVYDSVDLFSVKAETLKEDEDEDGDDDDGRGGGRSGGGARGGATGRRFRLMRSRRGGGGQQQQQEYGRRSSRGSVTSSASPAPAAGNSNNGGGGADGAVDPVSELLAQYHSKLVVESLQDHEELVLALLSHLLLAFVDTLQLKCRAATTDASVDPDERERSVVECMADTLSLATTLTPILMEHLLSPCFFELIARQLPDVAVSASAVAALLESKQQQYVQTYLSVVEEHCQLAVDAMMNTYLALTQQPITDFVRRQGFVQPLFDWQRVSRHTTAAVRPYIADAVACIARARETLNAIRQPILGSAATQRLVAHLVRVFLTAFTSDINVFELSGECSPNFLVMGLTLLEAEALTILKVVDTVVAHAAANPTSSELSPELVVARGSLASFAASLEAYAIGVCESIAVTRGREGTSDVLISLTLLSREKRRERRDEMVQAALRTLGYMLEAVNVELEESSLSSAGLMQARSSVTESIVQRLEHRNDGYELRRAKAAQKEQDRKDAEKRAAAAAALSRRKESADVSSAAAAAGDGAAGRRRLVHRRPDGAPPLQAPGGGVMAEEDGDVVVTPRTARESESESTNTVAAASNVLQLAQDQQHKTKVRKVRKVRKAAAALEVGEEGAEAAPAAAPVAPRSAAPAPPPAPLRQPAARANHSEEDDDAEDDAPVRTRPARRARRGAAAAAGGAAEDGGAPEPRERRANRFRRSNVV